MDYGNLLVSNLWLPHGFYFQKGWFINDWGIYLLNETGSVSTPYSQIRTKRWSQLSWTEDLWQRHPFLICWLKLNSQPHSEKLKNWVYFNQIIATEIIQLIISELLTLNPFSIIYKRIILHWTLAIINALRKNRGIG